MGQQKPKPSLDYVEVCALFSEAEGKLKKVEHLAGGIVIPAVNQLRYAGQHLVRILQGCGDPAKELLQAKNHCKRASFDACEAGLLYCLESFKRFQDDYRTTSISPIMTDYFHCCELARKAQTLIKVSTDEDKAESYKEAEACLDSLMVLIDRLPHIREELNKVIKSSRRNFIILISTLIVGIIAAILTGVAIFKPSALPSPTTTSPSPTSQVSIAAPESKGAIRK